MRENKFIKSILEDNKYLAHTSNEADKSKKPETIKEHSFLCVKYFDEIDRIKDIKHKVYKLLEESGCKEKDLNYVWNMFRNAVFLHDIGKINPSFQYKKMGNRQFKKKSKEFERESDHSLLSSYIYLSEYFKEQEQGSEIEKSPYLFSFAYIISRHHSYLSSPDKFVDRLTAWIDNKVYTTNINLRKPIFANTKKVLKKIINNEIEFFILSRLLFSLISTCDFYATSEYKSGKAVKIECENPFNEINENYTSSELYKSIYNYPKKQINDINLLRNQMFKEAEQTLSKNYDKNIFYLEAPTGSGKTNTSINLMLKLIKNDTTLKNVFYIFPFNTLVDQTKITLEKYIKPEYMSVINSLTPIKKSENEDYEAAYLNRIAMNYPIVVTSHINLFTTLFGTTREEAFSLSQLCNSIIVLDEIQSYRIDIWAELIIFLNSYAKMLNIKIIIMSATLPKLDIFLNKESDVVNLIHDTSYYFENPLFKNRVEADFSMLDEECNLMAIAEKVLEHQDKKVLIEFIKKRTAREFYKCISEMDCHDIQIVELTGDDNIDNREKILKQIKRAKRIIVVATQVIEAGVDIDLDIGFKDISTPDSEEQFIGRINRSCKKDGSKVFFFNYDKASDIYKRNGKVDYRLKYSINNKRYANLFVNKKFSELYKLVLKDIQIYRNQKNSNNIQNIYNACRYLNFSKVEDTMQLIEPNYQLFLGYRLRRNNGEIINGNILWEDFKELCTNNRLPYAEKRVKLSDLQSKMALFTYNLRYADAAKSCGEEFGGYIYIQNGKDFIEDGKFNRQKLFEYSTRLIL